MKRTSIFTIYFKLIPNDTERFYQVIAGEVHKDQEKYRLINMLLKSGEITEKEISNVKLLRIVKQ
jgi:hypothetical protein